ncbi:MAG: radical SAM protein [Candidatus Bathyarchaeota archaeon]|nr:radical SAM protein [Candidatus Bathyarchaeota archaeon]
MGELYEPRGKALEHARVILETENPHAVNVSLGCPVGCGYCYGPLSTRQSRENWRQVRYPKKNTVDLITKQLGKGLEPVGVFISFLTDPLIPRVRESTEEVARLLLDRGIRVATSSKLGLSSVDGVRHGMTLVSLDDEFSRREEGNAPSPKWRLQKLKDAHERGEYTWVSLEPCPCPGIWKQDLYEVLEELCFVDLMILGKWNYDKRTSTTEAREYYQGAVDVFRDFCTGHSIRNYVKSGTLKFIEAGSVKSVGL